MPSVYFWCTGQDDNLGDVVLRRRLLQVIVDPRDVLGASLRIYVGSASASFVDGLAIPPNSRIYSSKTAWLSSLVMQMVRPRAPVLVFNPGEVQRNLKTALAYMSLLIPAAIIRLRGGVVARTGIAVDHRDTGPSAAVAKLAIRAVTTTASIVSWRDIGSRSEFNGGRLVPDWAIEDLSDYGRAYNRTLLAVTYRSDRQNAFDHNAIAKIHELATLHELSVVVYCQVRRDRIEMQRLANEEGWGYVDWAPSASHRNQETVVRSLLSQSRFVCSNRIHALIIGLTEGAQAICISSEDEPKVQTHLEHFGLAAISDPRRLKNTRVLLFGNQQRRNSAEALKKASADVDDFARLVRKSIGQMNDTKDQRGSESKSNMETKRGGKL